MKRSANHGVHLWQIEIGRAEAVLGCIGPDDICCEGLSPRQAHMLRVLADREGARLSDLAAAAGISPSAITRVIEKLEARGMVRRVRGEQSDRRAAMVAITPQGRRVRARIDEMVLDRSRAVMEAIPPERRSPVLEALRLFNDALQAAGCCGPNYKCTTPDGSLVKIGNTTRSDE